MFQENYLVIIVIILVLALLAFALFRPKSKSEQPATQGGGSTLPLQLQAYERLIILAERIGLRHLIGNLPTEGLSAKEYQATLIEAIKREYEYNVSQQIYVAPKAWEAVKNLKEQNIYVINQLGSYMSNDGSGRDLARAIAEYLTGHETAGLQQVVTEALNIEAKKLMH